MSACLRCNIAPALPGHRFCSPCGRIIHAGSLQRSGLCMRGCGRTAQQGHRFCVPCGRSYYR
ncbi:hypothetical protein CMEL01_15530 [Colletotrichum melonis]|uniref:DZANK-type domain-containing protein n=1 Tax=Colletotrichum melonis TaxID=1209925 RepID=A0AAI9UIV9_9PEZI|nr:hypothetical protein CMEL01_15530 [Colletotrichum melonis]